MEKYIWKRRTDEWIKANPKQGTMYKEPVKEIAVENPYKITPNPKIEKVYKEPKPIKEPEPQDWSKAGVYLIICGIEKYAYIGQSYNIDVRLRNHKMNIIDNKTGAQTKAYSIMREHYIKHGIEALEFIKYKYMPNVERDELERAEMGLLLEYHKMGYKLYNQSISMHILEFIK